MQDFLTAEITKRGETPRTAHLIATVQSLDKNFALGARTGVYCPLALLLCPLFKHLTSSFKILAAHRFVPWCVAREAPIEMTLFACHSFCFGFLHAVYRTAVRTGFDVRVFARVGYEPSKMLFK